MAVAWVLLLTLITATINYRYRRHAASSPPPAADGNGLSALDMSIPDLQRVFDLRAEAALSDKMISLPMFVSLILQPEKSRMRTVETVSLEGRVIVQDVTVELSLSDALLDDSWERREASEAGGDDRSGHGAETGNSEIYVPILNCPKKEMIDNFRVRDREGRDLDILCYEETIQLISSSLHFLIQAALRESDPEMMSLDGIDRAEALFLMLICGNTTASQKTTEKTIQAGLSHIGINGKGDDEAQTVTWLREFLRTLAHAFPVVAVVSEIDVSRRLQISYSRTTIPPNKSKHFRHWLRLMLGLRPVTVQMSPGMAHNSKSYHLQVKAPDSQYLMEQTLRCAECGRKLSSSEIEADSRGGCEHVRPSGDGEPYFQLLRKRGQHYAHLYMRGFAGLQRQNIRLTASFGEVPPGTLASAAITAVTSFLLIGAVGVAETTRLARDSDIPAVLLVIPAVAASWFGFVSDTEAVLRSSLAARCSLILGGFTSIAASVLFIVSGVVQQDAGDRPAAAGQTGQTGDSTIVLGIGVGWWWSTLVYLAGANLVYVLVQLVVRSNAYRRLLRKEALFNDDTVT
ncbi:hypothetical protein GCM10017673_13280 [Streptosporangium violaceochromogenes]|nr:hypothetical protein GCM10017673_13280 [Streptosporangium violaceochromogenes]